MFQDILDYEPYLIVKDKEIYYSYNIHTEEKKILGKEKPYFLDNKTLLYYKDSSIIIKKENSESSIDSNMQIKDVQFLPLDPNVKCIENGKFIYYYGSRIPIKYVVVSSKSTIKIYKYENRNLIDMKIEIKYLGKYFVVGDQYIVISGKNDEYILYDIGKEKIIKHWKGLHYSVIASINHNKLIVYTKEPKIEELVTKEYDIEKDEYSVNMEVDFLYGDYIFINHKNQKYAIILDKTQSDRFNYAYLFDMEKNKRYSLNCFYVDDKYTISLSENNSNENVYEILSIGYIGESKVVFFINHPINHPIKHTYVIYDFISREIKVADSLRFSYNIISNRYSILHDHLYSLEYNDIDKSFKYKFIEIVPFIFDEQVNNMIRSIDTNFIPIDIKRIIAKLI